MAKATPQGTVAKKKPAQRGHTDRSAKTRERVMEAAIELVAEDGFFRASTNRIAEKAGVTWGVLQYHFGDKQSILSAVLERSFAGLMAELRAASVKGGSVEERVVRIVDVAWEISKSASNRATLELLVNARASQGNGKQGAGPPYALLAQMEVENAAFWQETFGDLEVDPARSSAVRRMFFATLHGLLLFHLIDQGIEFEAERKVLAEAIASLLKGDAAEERG
jgi:AcrR family transcriptional regulator